MMDPILLRSKEKRQISKEFYLALFFLIFLLPSVAWAQLILSDNGDITISAIVIDRNAPVDNGGSHGGSSGGSLEVTPTDISFSGLAYPNAKVILLLGGSQVTQTVADSKAIFTLKLSNLTPGVKVFSVVAEDKEGIRSILLTLPITIEEKTSTTISNLFMPPTSTIQKTSLVRGEKVAVHGYSVQNANVILSVDSKDDQNILADMVGLYSGSIGTDFFPVGEHAVQAKSEIKKGQEKILSGVGKIGYFFIVLNKEQTIEDKADIAQVVDINNDKVINIVDFSILAYWYQKPTAPKNLDFNGDGKVTIADFSILAYYWNG